MTNEWKEFLAYTGQPDYSASKKSDTHWMSRFTMKMILDMLGYYRVLTIIARGYLFHEPDGSLKAGDPYERIEYARNALCAWCSVPVIEKSDPQTNFGALADIFPELERMLACSDSDGNMAAYGECNMMSSRIFAKRK